jgi:NodT family efflux transporter outer membrane factor (OMF) lipoprotein
MIRLSRLIGAASLLALGACSMTPTYETPALKSAPPAQFKALEGWKTATPSDLLDRGDWWTLLDDPQLNALAERVKLDNQTIARAEAAYRQARALVREQRASLFPSIDLSSSATKSGGGGTKTTTSVGGATRAGDTQRYQVGIGASWEPDVWGRIRAGISGARFSAEASAADLAAAQLSAQGELATSYLGLRRADAEIAMVQATGRGLSAQPADHDQPLQAAIAPKSDVLQAQVQLANAQSTLDRAWSRIRATFENAIAVLVGEPASGFRIAAVTDWKPVVPEIPIGVPSTLLERRPDVAAAERRVAAANTDIGVASSAFFPTCQPVGQRQFDLQRAGRSVHHLGQHLVAGPDGRPRPCSTPAPARPGVEQSRAAYDATAADYRQTVLTAFQDVEDQLTAGDVLRRQYVQLETASRAADQTEAMILNQYRSGTVAYTDVVTAQATALSARRALLQGAVDRQTTAVALIQAIGGGWR